VKPRSLFQPRAAHLRVVQDSATEVELLLYDEIGFWGVTATEFKTALDAISAGTIHLRINSPGGDVFDGLAMYNALVDHPARVVTHVDGLAASMASVVALAGDEVQMAENAFFMIHDPWTLSIGNATQLRKDAMLLDKIGGSVEATYMQRTGSDATQMRAWMEAETWFTAAEAEAAGFIDEITTKDAGAENLVAAAAAAFDLSVYAHVPEPLVAHAGDATLVSTRELEQTLRDAGLSRVAAKTMVSQWDADSPWRAGPTVGTQRDAETVNPSAQAEWRARGKREMEYIASLAL